MTRIFVTGSGTEVGKTFLCCRLLEAFAGRNVRAIKPIVSGFDPAAPESSDTARLIRAQGRGLDAASIEATSPWRFRAPLSPDMAAAREGRTIAFDDVVAWSRIDEGQDLTLIEGVGGALVPLDARHTTLDWIAALEPHVLLVAGSYLGSISHALATLAALEARGIGVDVIALSESAEPAAPLAEIRAVVQRFAGTVPVEAIGRPPTNAQIARLVARLGV